MIANFIVYMCHFFLYPFSCCWTFRLLQFSSLALFSFRHWRRKWQPTPVFLLGESQGRGSLVGCCLWGRTESDMTKVTQQQFSSVQSLSSVRLFVTPWIVAHQASLSITNSWSSLKLTSIESVIQPSHPLPFPSLALNPSQHQSLFQWVNSSHEVAKVPEFQL